MGDPGRADAMQGEFNPYYRWLGIPPKDQPPNHYRLLGIELFEPDANVIDAAADRQMSHVRRYQTGEHSAESQTLLNELAAARICLLNPEKRAVYDRTLEAELAKAKGPAKETPEAPGKTPPPLPALEAAPREVIAMPGAVPSAVPASGVTSEPGALPTEAPLSDPNLAVTPATPGVTSTPGTAREPGAPAVNWRRLALPVGVAAAGIVLVGIVVALQSRDGEPPGAAQDNPGALPHGPSLPPGYPRTSGGTEATGGGASGISGSARGSQAGQPVAGAAASPEVWSARPDPPDTAVVIQKDWSLVSQAATGSSQMLRFPSSYSPIVLMAGDGGNRPGFQALDVGTGRVVGGFTGTVGPRDILDVTPDAQRAIAYDRGPRPAVRVFSLQTGTAICDLEADSLTPLDMVTVSDGRSVGVCERNARHWLTAWDLDTGRIMGRAVLPGGRAKTGWPGWLAASPGRRYCAMVREGAIYVYDTATLKCVGRSLAPVPTDPDDYRPSVAFSPDGQRVAALITPHRSDSSDVEYLVCWYMASGKLLLNTTLRTYGDPAQDYRWPGYYGPEITWRADGRAILVHGRLLVDARKGSRLATLPKTPGTARKLFPGDCMPVSHFDSRERKFIVALARLVDDRIVVPDSAPSEVASSDPASPSPTPSEPWTSCVDPPSGYSTLSLPRSFSADFPPGFWIAPQRPSSYIGLLGDDEMTLFDLRNGRVQDSLKFSEKPGLRPTLSPDGRYFAACASYSRMGSDARVFVWSFEKNGLAWEFERTGRGMPSFLGFACDGLLTLFHSSAGLEAVVWDLEAGRLLLGFRLYGPPREGERIAYLSPTVSPGGRYLAVTRRSPTCSVGLFDLHTGKRVATALLPDLPSDEKYFGCPGLVFSHDGTELTGAFTELGSSYYRLVTWDLSNGTVLADRQPEYDSGRRLRELTLRLPTCGRALDVLPDKSGWLLAARAVIDRDRNDVEDFFPDRDMWFRGALGHNAMLTVTGSSGAYRLDLQSPSSFRRGENVAVTPRPIGGGSSIPGPSAVAGGSSIPRGPSSLGGSSGLRLPPGGMGLMPGGSPRSSGVPPVKKAAVPDEAACQAALEELRDIFKDEYAAANRPEGREALAEKLRLRSLGLAPDEPAHYVMLREALVHAVGAGDVLTADDVLDRLADRYEVDALSLRAKALTDLSRTVRDPSARSSLLEKLGEACGMALAEDRYDEAEQMALKAMYVAGRNNSEGERQTAQTWRDRIRMMKHYWEQSKPAFETLKTSPDDPDANLAVGLFYCGVKDDWDKGCPHLAKSSEPALQIPAQLEIDAAGGQIAPIRLADAWWDAALARSPTERGPMLLRARFWYLQVSSHGAGLDKVKAQKRISEIPVPGVFPGNQGQSSRPSATHRAYPPRGIRPSP